SEGLRAQADDQRHDREQRTASGEAASVAPDVDADARDHDHVDRAEGGAANYALHDTGRLPQSRSAPRRFAKSSAADSLHGAIRRLTCTTGGRVVGLSRSQAVVRSVETFVLGSRSAV